jgi:hypothetical protein
VKHGLADGHRDRGHLVRRARRAHLGCVDWARRAWRQIWFRKQRARIRRSRERSRIALQHISRKQPETERRNQKDRCHVCPPVAHEQICYLMLPPGGLRFARQRSELRLQNRARARDGWQSGTEFFAVRATKIGNY